MIVNFILKGPGVPGLIRQYPDASVPVLGIRVTVGVSGTGLRVRRPQ